MSTIESLIALWRKQAQDLGRHGEISPDAVATLQGCADELEALAPPAAPVLHQMWQSFLSDLSKAQTKDEWSRRVQRVQEAMKAVPEAEPTAGWPWMMPRALVEALKQNSASHHRESVEQPDKTPPASTAMNYGRINMHPVYYVQHPTVQERLAAQNLCFFKEQPAIWGQVMRAINPPDPAIAAWAKASETLQARSPTPDAVPAEATTALTKWNAEQDPGIRRRADKTTEECSELVIVCARISMQGLQGINPKTGKTNRQELTEEMADVLAQIDCNMGMLTASERMAVCHRRAEKVAVMDKWEAMYPEQKP